MCIVPSAAEARWRGGRPRPPNRKRCHAPRVAHESHWRCTCLLCAKLKGWTNRRPEVRFLSSARTPGSTRSGSMHRSPKGSRMNFCRRTVSLLILCVIVSVPSWGQITEILQGSNETKKPAPPGPTDPLGRDTPNGTLFGFLQAMQNGSYLTAAQYLQMSPTRRAKEGELVAKELKALLDEAFVGSLRSISTSPEGSAQMGLPPDREKVGTLSVDDSEADVILARVNDPTAGKIWLFSADTLSKLDRSEEHTSE